MNEQQPDPAELQAALDEISQAAAAEADEAVTAVLLALHEKDGPLSSAHAAGAQTAIVRFVLAHCVQVPEVPSVRGVIASLTPIIARTAEALIERAQPPEPKAPLSERLKGGRRAT